MNYLMITLLIGLLVALHEFGHVLAAKLARIPVARFSIGIGPRLIGFTRGNTDYCLSAIPFGGYVMPGLDPLLFERLSAGKRILFAVGGPAANLFGAYLSLVWLNMLYQVDFLSAVLISFDDIWQMFLQFLSGLMTIFSQPEAVSGVVGLVAIGGEKFGGSLSGLLNFSILLNINLMILNLLPIPPLDGGKILFTMFEKIWRPIMAWQQRIAIAGWALLLGLMVYATVADISKLMTAGI